MSLSVYFKKKSKTALAVATLGLSAVGGYAGFELGDNLAPQTASTQSVFTNAGKHPSLSTLTFAQQNQQSFEGAVTEKVRSAQAGLDPERAARISYFLRAIDDVAKDGAEQKSSSDPLRRRVLEALRAEKGVRLIDEIRLEEHITEKDYRDLTNAFDARAGVKPSWKSGNYRKGAMYHQECRMAAGVAAALSSSALEVEAADIGACMKEQFKHPENRQKDAIGGGVGPDSATLATGAAGAVAGGLLALPFWRRRRRPKI